MFFMNFPSSSDLFYATLQMGLKATFTEFLGSDIVSKFRQNSNPEEWIYDNVDVGTDICLCTVLACILYSLYTFHRP